MIPLAIPNVSGKEGAYLDECVRTNFVSSVGPFVGRLEEMCAQACGAPHAVATSSGTTGLHLALTAVGVKPGDLVVLPSFTFIASSNAISHCAASPWLFDVTEESWTLDPAQVRAQLQRATVRRDGALIHRETGRRVAAIMPVATLGHPPDLDGFAGVSAEFGLPIVVDAAAALGARYKGAHVGNRAQLSVISFNGNKTVTAGGGGMVVGGDEKLMRWVRHLSTTARASLEYEHDAVGFNYRMTNLQAAVGCAQMERLEEFVTAKRCIDARYRSELADAGVGFFPVASWATSACWFSGAILKPGASRDVRSLCASMRERGIEARTFWKPVHLQAPYAACPRTEMPVCEQFWQRILTLPCSTNLTDADQAFVIRTLRELLG
jgi:perosamine synthetase